MSDEIEASEAWAAFVDMRKAKGKRAPFTDLARKRILFELRRMQADGQDIDEVLWTSVTNGWSGVFPIRRKGWQPAPAAPDTRAAETQAYLQSQRMDDKERAAADEARRRALGAIKVRQ